MKTCAIIVRGVRLPLGFLVALLLTVALFGPGHAAAYPITGVGLAPRPPLATPSDTPLIQPTATAPATATAVPSATPTSPPSATPSATPCGGPCPVGWTVQDSGTGQSLGAVAALAFNDAWAGGDAGLLHWDGVSWQLATMPVTGTVRSLVFRAPTEGYALVRDTDTSYLLDWDGQSWQVQAATPWGLRQLSMVGPQDGWALGGPECSACGFVHIAGASLRYYPVPYPYVTPVPWVSQLHVYSLAMDSPTHGVAFGNYYVDPEINWLADAYSWNGTEWSWAYFGGAGTYLAGGSADAVLLPGGTEGWVVGGSIVHFVNLEPTIEEWYSSVIAVTATTSGEAWAVGYDAYHYVGGVWQPVSLPPVPGVLDDISFAPDGSGWAVSNQGAIMFYDPRVVGQWFFDVPPAHPFYPFINDLAARGIVSGYRDGTFHSETNLTRAQLTKMTVLGLGWPLLTPPTPTFHDVPASFPFYSYIETAAAHLALSGYADGTFRPQANVTRGQVAKILVNAKGWGPLLPGTATFTDVPVGSPFFGFVEQAVARGVVGGYNCGGPGEPCPARYFRPNGAATRGHISRMLWTALATP